MADLKQITVNDVTYNIKDETARNGLSGKQDTLTFDSTPTSGSSNPVTSGGIYSAVNGADKVFVGTGTCNESTFTGSITTPYADFLSAYNSGKKISVNLVGSLWGGSYFFEMTSYNGSYFEFQAIMYLNNTTAIALIMQLSSSRLTQRVLTWSVSSQS